MMRECVTVIVIIKWLIIFVMLYVSSGMSKGHMGGVWVTCRRALGSPGCPNGESLNLKIA